MLPPLAYMVHNARQDTRGHAQQQSRFIRYVTAITTPTTTTSGYGENQLSIWHSFKFVNGRV